MNEVLKQILDRRSVKKYKSTQVPKELIDEVINAGLHAASGMGKQAPIIISITDKKVRDDLSKLNASFLGTNIDPFYNAPCVLVVLAPKSMFTYIYDGSLVMGNMMLAAESLGLGACWIHRAKEEFESEYGKELLFRLGLSDEYEGIGNLILGYREGDYHPHYDIKGHRVYYI